MITLQSRLPDGSWGTRKAFTDENKLVRLGHMPKAALLALAAEKARQWYATAPHMSAELRVFDSEAVEVEQSAPVTPEGEAHFVVCADHVFPRFAFTNHPVRAKRDRYDGTWYATSDGLGCSKNYRTARDAAVSLFLDNACTHVRVY